MVEKNISNISKSKSQIVAHYRFGKPRHSHAIVISQKPKKINPPLISHQPFLRGFPNTQNRIRYYIPRIHSRGFILIAVRSSQRLPEWCCLVEVSRSNDLVGNLIVCFIGVNAQISTGIGSVSFVPECREDSNVRLNF